MTYSVTIFDKDGGAVDKWQVIAGDEDEAWRIAIAQCGWYSADYSVEVKRDEDGFSVHNRRLAIALIVAICLIVLADAIL